jgi:SulP family sulfate permease
VRLSSHVRFEPLVLALLVIGASAFLSPRWPRLPAPLFGVALALAVATFAGLHEKEVGVLSLSLPPFAGFNWQPSDVTTVLPQALGLAFVTSVNLLVTSRVIEHFRGVRKRLKKADADAELGAYSIANVCAGMFGAPISVGIPARSLALLKCGGRTRMANLWHALILAGVLALGSGLLSRVPLAALAGVTAYMGVRLLEWSTWRRLPRMRFVDAASFMLTAISSLAINAVAAIALGCAVYVIEWVYKKVVLLARIQPVQAEAGE